MITVTSAERKLQKLFVGCHDEEIAYYLEQYPTEKKLIKLAERRGIVVEE